MTLTEFTENLRHLIERAKEARVKVQEIREILEQSSDELAEDEDDTESDPA